MEQSVPFHCKNYVEKRFLEQKFILTKKGLKQFGKNNQLLLSRSLRQG
jgi:hypothetical protein